MQLFNLSKLPIYLPYDTAPLPFGDPLSGVTYTAATPSVFTVKGYIPTQNARVQLSVSGGAVLDTNFAAANIYYVTSITAAAGTFSLSSTANGAAIQSYTTGLQAGGLASTTAHLLSGQFDGTVQPFKSGDTVVAFNLSTQIVYLQGANDLNTSGNYGNPQGPGASTLLATINTSSVVTVVLQADWILTTSAGPGTLALVQN
jgi:hypothetical protein